MRENELLELLDFSHCNNKKEVLQHSEDVAEELINNWKIVSPKGERRFLGLEFYLYIQGVFPDDATHCHDSQLDSGTFYFHTRSKHPQWSPPIFNRHGIDITCGNRKRGIYGGILLRHLGGVGNRDGSGYALRSLIRGDEGFKKIARGSEESGWSGSEDIFFREMNRKSIFGHKLHLAYAPTIEKVKPETATRVGLNKKKQYAQEPLRFFCPDNFLKN